MKPLRSYAGKRGAVLAAARGLFLERGFEGVAMDEVATRAGVSKVTVYRHFPTKSVLLAAVVHAEGEGKATDSTPRPAPQTRDELVFTLEAMLTRLMTFLDQDDIVRLGCLLMSQAPHHPELAREFYAHGPAFGHETMRALLADAAEKSILSIDDPDLAAERLLALCFHRHELGRNFGVMPPLTPEARAARVRRAIDGFLAIYG